MCYFITATLPSGADLASVRAVTAPEGSSWTPLLNPFVRRQLPASWGYYCLTGSNCDCQSALVRSDIVRGKSLKLPRAAARWSQTKQDRWLEQRGHLIAERETAARGDVVAWHEYLKRVLGAVGTPPVGLLIHFYDAGVDNEHIVIARRSAMRVYEIQPATLQTLEPDVLYELS
jgi:hypothetical protein